MNFTTFMNYTLALAGYQNIEEVPKEVFLNTVLTYFTNYTHVFSLDVFELFKEYTKIVKSKEDIEDIIYYLLGYISIIQNHQVNWYINESEEPRLSFNIHNPNIVDGLNTQEKFAYDKAFALLLHVALELKNMKEEGYSR